VELTARRVEELFEKGVSVVILAGPGSSHLEVAKRVPGSKIISYKLTGLEWLQGEGRVELLEFEGGEPFAGGKTLAEYVEEAGPARVIVVPESTIEAIRAYSLLRERLGENKVALVFTPGVHKEGLGFKPPREAEVDYTPVFKALKVEPEGGGRGVSLKLLQHREKEDWEELRRGAEALRGLSPGRLGLGGALVNAGRRALSSLSEPLAEEFYAAAGGAAVASALAALASPPGFPVVVAQAVGFVFPPSLLLEIARELIGAGGGRPEREHVKRLAELIQAAIVAAEFVEREELEGVADEVASQWGLSLDEFKNFVENLRKLATQEVVTEEELEKLREEVGGDLEALEQRLRGLFKQRIDQLREELEERLGQLEERVEELERKVGGIEGELGQLQALAGVYKKPRDLGFDLERGTFKVGNNEYRLVTSGRFMEHAGKLLEALECGELVVVTGPRGVGKSVLARYALAKLLETGHWRVYEVETLDERSAAEVTESLHEATKSSPWRLAVLYDPSAPLYYEPGYELSLSPGVGLTVWMLARLHRGQGGRISVVVVLPDDLYERVKDRLERAYVLEVNLKQENFLAGIVRDYSRGACGEEVYESIAREVVARYEGGYTLGARYAGEWLREAGRCDEKAVRDALEAGAGSAEAFIINFIYRYVLRGNLDLFQKIAIPFVARAELGPLPPKWLERFPVLKRGADGSYVVKCLEDPLEYLSDEEKRFIREWLSQPKENTVEGVIWGIASGGLSERLQKLAEEGLASREILEVVREMEERVKEVKDAMRRASFEGRCSGEDPLKVLFKALTSDPEFRELAKENSYHFVALVGLAHTPLPAEPFLREVGLPEGLKEWLTVRDEVPRSVREFLVETTPAFRDTINPCQVLKSIYQRAVKERRYSDLNLVVSLGALTVSRGELEGCPDEAVIMTRFSINAIPLLVVSPVLTRVEEALVKFVGELVWKGRPLEAVAVAHSATKREPVLASGLLRIIEQGAGRLDKLDVLVRTLYEEADYLARRARGGGFKEWVERVEAFLMGLEEDAVGLHARALLGARLADALSIVGSAWEALKWAREARRALERLEWLSNTELADGLKPLLKIVYPFMVPEEAAELLLEELKLAVLFRVALVELGVDAEKALRLADEACRAAEKLGPSKLALSRSLRARAMLLAGRKREDVIRELRENWELALSRSFINLDEEVSEAITAEYAASFLLEGKPEEALEQYWKHDFLIRNSRARAMLLALILACDVEKARDKVIEVFMENRRLALTYSAPDLLAFALRVLYGEASEEGVWDNLMSWEHEIFADILGVVRKSNVNMLLLRLKEVLDIGELEPYLKGLSALEALEAIVATVTAPTTFVEIVYQTYLKNNAALARRLTGLVQEELERRGFALMARLWGELAQSLESGFNEEFRKALIGLFYLYV